MRVFFLLKGMSENGKLPHGALAKVAKIFGMAHVDPLIMSQRAGRPPKYGKDDLRDQRLARA